MNPTLELLLLVLFATGALMYLGRRAYRVFKSLKGASSCSKECGCSGKPDRRRN